MRILLVPAGATAFSRLGLPGLGGFPHRQHREGDSSHCGAHFQMVITWPFANLTAVAGIRNARFGHGVEGGCIHISVGILFAGLIPPGARWGRRGDNSGNRHRALFLHDGCGMELPAGLSRLRKKALFRVKAPKDIPRGLKPVPFTGRSFSATCKANLHFVALATHPELCPDTIGSPHRVLPLAAIRPI